MNIEITTPYRHVVSDEAEEVYAIGPKGQFGVLPGHVHYVTPLCLGRLSFQKKGKKHSFLVEDGYIEVYQENIYVFADHVEKAQEIDLTRSKFELERLNQQLLQGSSEPEQFEKLLQQRDKEQWRVQIASEAL